MFPFGESHEYLLWKRSSVILITKIQKQARWSKCHSRLSLLGWNQPFQPQFRSLSYHCNLGVDRRWMPRDRSVKEFLQIHSMVLGYPRLIFEESEGFMSEPVVPWHLDRTESYKIQLPTSGIWVAWYPPYEVLSRSSPARGRRFMRILGPHVRRFLR